MHPRSVTVGQPVTLTVDVYVPSFFTGAPRFPQLEVKDAVVVFIDEGTNLNQRAGQQDYAGQRRSYRIYPQREGEFVVPDFAVKVSFTGEDGPTRVPAPAKGGSFQATIPAGARGHRSLPGHQLVRSSRPTPTVRSRGCERATRSRARSR